jgi:hypothetical protein
MSNNKKIYVRLGVEDIVLPVEEVENFNGYLTAIDEEGNEIATPCSYTIGYEDKDGNECEEDGTPL